MASQNQIHQLQAAENKLRQQLSETEKEVLSKEKELASAEKLMEVVIILLNQTIICLLHAIFFLLNKQEKRTELLETQALLEAERVSQTNPEKRGMIKLIFVLSCQTNLMVWKRRKFNFQRSRRSSATS